MIKYPQEHLGRDSNKSQDPSPIFDHCNTTVHTTTVENFSKVGREDQNRTSMEPLKNQYMLGSVVHPSKE